VDEGLLFAVAGAWVLSPVALAVLLGLEARRRRRLEDAIAVVEARLAQVDRLLSGTAAAPGSTAAATAPPRAAIPTTTAPLETVLPPPLPPSAPEPPPIATAPPPSRPPAPGPPAAAEPPPAAGARPPPPPRVEPWRIDWERLVGVKLYSWLAGVAVAVAAVSFARYSIEHGWLVAPVRLAVGIACGVALLAGAETRLARRYAVTAQALAAGGVVTLFATLWAAHALWRLVPALPTFGLLALVAAVAVLLAVRRDALVVALLGLAGGFSTPYLLSTGEDRPLGLFSYLLVLNVGLAWVARRKRWPLLSALSLALTAAYQGGWVLRFLRRPDQLPVAVAVFLVFAALGFAALALAPRRDEPPPLARWTAALGAIPPALFALHAASRPELLERWPLLLGFVAVLSAGLAAVAAWQGPEWLHLVGAATPVAAVVAFVARAPAGSGWPGAGAFVLAFAAIQLGAPHLAAKLGRPFRAEARFGAWAAPLLFVALVAAARAQDPVEPWSFAAVALLLLAACALSAALRGDGPFLAAALALAAVALTAPALPAGEAGAALARLLSAPALAAVALATPLLAARAGRALRLPVEPEPPLEAFALLAPLLVLQVAAHGPPGGGAALAPVLAVLAVVHLALVADALRRRTGVVLLAGAAAALLVVTVAGARGLGPLPAGAAHVVLVGSVMTVAWRGRCDRLGFGGAAVAAVAILAGSTAPWAPLPALLAAIPPWLLAVAQPLLRGAPGRRERYVWVGAVLASGSFFLVAREALVDLGAAPFIGALPVLQALALVPHVALLVRGRGPGEETRPRGTLALVAGAALAFVTVAVPLQLEKQWITIGWALEAAALAWLWRRVPHRGLLGACAVLLAAVLVRLLANPEVLRYHARSATPIWNWYLYAYLSCAVAAFVASRLLAGGEDRLFPRWPRLSSLAAASGAALLFALLNVEIADFFSSGERLELRFSAGLAQDLTYTIAWALFAVGLLAAGVLLRSRAARAAAIALLSATVLKAFLHDLARLHGLYRVASFVGLAASLAVVAVVLQRFVLRPPEGRPPPEAA
jgi:hypothetical protein